MKLRGVPISRQQWGHLQVTVHGQPSVMVPSSVWARLASGPYLDAVVRVEVVPRELVRQLWRHDQPGRTFPGYYAFRAYARGNRIVLLSDRTETPASLTWLLLHELAHVLVNRSPMLDEAFSSIPRPANYMTNDAAHEAYPEEQFANLVADRMASHFDSRPGLNRIWWRQRVQALRSDNRA